MWRLKVKKRLFSSFKTIIIYGYTSFLSPFVDFVDTILIMVL